MAELQQKAWADGPTNCFACIIVAFDTGYSTQADLRPEVLNREANDLWPFPSDDPGIARIPGTP
jgi:hypothetical protein